MILLQFLNQINTNILTIKPKPVSSINLNFWHYMYIFIDIRILIYHFAGVCLYIDRIVC
jgi:hypothetical protein